MAKKYFFLILLINFWPALGLFIMPAFAQGMVYTLSGQITGDAKDDVTVSCGSRKATTDYSGNYSIAPIAQGSCCDITPSNSDYEFYPLSIRHCFINANANGVNFIATFVSHSDYYDGSVTVKKINKDMFNESSGTGRNVANNKSTPSSALPALSGNNNSKIESNSTVSAGKKNSASSSINTADSLLTNNSNGSTRANYSGAPAPKTGLSQTIILSVALSLALTAMGIFLIFKRKRG